MYLSYRAFAFAALFAAVGLGWSAYRSSTSEIVVLRIFDDRGDEDVFATLWVIDDDHGFTWVRAHRRDARWLTALSKEPNVKVRRAGTTQPYIAHIFDTQLARRTVGPVFRDKYGLADRWRTFRNGDDPVPIRLERP
jgi:hypothetical protein